MILNIVIGKYNKIIKMHVFLFSQNININKFKCLYNIHNVVLLFIHVIVYIYIILYILNNTLLSCKLKMINSYTRIVLI